MKKHMVVLLALLMLGLAMSAYGTVWKTFSSQEYGYSLKYPSGWEVSTLDERSFTITTPGEGLMPTVVLVMVEDIDDSDYEASFEDTMEEAMQEIQDEIVADGMATLTVVDQELVEINGHDSYWTHLDMSIMGMFSMRMDLYIFQHKDHLIILSFTTDSEGFQDNSEVFGTIIDSFKLK